MSHRSGFCVLLVLSSMTILMALLLHVWSRQSLSMYLLQHRCNFYQKAHLLAGALRDACLLVKIKQYQEQLEREPLVTKHQARIKELVFQVTTSLVLDRKTKEFYSFDIKCTNNLGKGLSLSGLLSRKGDHVIADYVTLRSGIR